jgi:hypothetical protein
MNASKNGNYDLVKYLLLSGAPLEPFDDVCFPPPPPPPPPPQYPSH